MAPRIFVRIFQNHESVSKFCALHYVIPKNKIAFTKTDFLRYYFTSKTMLNT